MGPGERAQIGLGVGVAQIGAEDMPLARVALPREGEQAAGRQHARHPAEDRGEIADIDQHVGGENEIGGAGLAEPGDHVADGEGGVEAFRLGLRQHGGREVDALDATGARAERFRHQPGAAPEIERAREHAPGREPIERGDEEVRRAIAERADEMAIEPVGVIVEQRRDMGRRGRGEGQAIEPRVAHGGASDIGRVERQRGAKGRPGRVPVARPLAPFAEEHVAGRESGRAFERLGREVDRGHQIAVAGVTPRELETAIGDGVPGGAARHRRRLAPARPRRYLQRMRASDLLHPRPEGLYCPPADVYIDAMTPVARCLVTHGHSDHARAGHGAVLATAETLDIMALRLGDGFTSTRQIAEFGRPITIGEARITFHPAGHVLGSAQIAIEARGTRVVVSGDYKRQRDPTSAAFEPIPCDVFLTEATFGIPVFRHPDADGEIGKLLASLSLFPDRPHLVGAYALGKAQRLIALIRRSGFDRPIYLHGALQALCAYYQERGIDLGDLQPVAGQPKGAFAGQIVLCPPGAMADLWSRRFGDPVTCYASGWMRIRARARQRGVELPLVISDHVDWHDLTRTIRETGCGELWITHGEAGPLCRWAEIEGLAAKPLHLVRHGEEEAQ